MTPVVLLCSCCHSISPFLSLSIYTHTHKHKHTHTHTVTFEQMDHTGKGVIDKETFIRATSTKMAAETAEGIFKKLDIDNVGYITFSEFIGATLSEKYFQDEEAVVETFNQLVDSQTGTIDLKSLKDHFGHMYTQKELEEMIAEMDLKHTGAITLDEFREAIQGHHEVSGVYESPRKSKLMQKKFSGLRVDTGGTKGDSS